MDTRRPIDAQAFLLTTLLCLIWGFQQVAIKFAAADLSPLMQIGIRSGLAALLVALAMRWQGEAVFVRDGSGNAGMAAGLLFAIEFVLIGEGLRCTSASHMVVFLYTAPVFAALGLHVTLPSERLAPLQWAGIALAFAGILVAFLMRGGTSGTSSTSSASSASGTTGSNVLLGDTLALAAGIAWGATTVVIRNSVLAKASAKRTLLYQLAGASVLALAVALASGQSGWRVTPMLLVSMTFQTFVVAFFSYLAWFWLMRRYLASRLGVFTFMSPLFGVAFGVTLLGETLEPSFLVGAAMVLAGVVMVSGYDWVRRPRAAPRVA
jgi:drug/metabolite transporter (DMT)-like permease